MKMNFLTHEILQTLPLCWRMANLERENIKSIIIYSELSVMLKKLFQALESLLRAIMYFMILIIGLAATVLGAFLVIFLAVKREQSNSYGRVEPGK